MNELKENVASMIRNHFDRKVQYVNWYFDFSAKEDVEDIAEECIDNILCLLNDCDEDIDNYMEEFNETHEREEKEELKLVMDDMRSQDEMEESLWNN